jgi:hypothetical protein
MVIAVQVFIIIVGAIPLVMISTVRAIIMIVGPSGYLIIVKIPGTVRS